MIDFTNCRVIPGRAYNGANGSKIAVEYNGEAYMLKFPPSAEGKPTDLSYTNSCISEHIASSIFNMLGIQAQETMLGTFTVKGKEKLVCACKDFTAGARDCSTSAQSRTQFLTLIATEAELSFLT